MKQKIFFTKYFKIIILFICCNCITNATAQTTITSAASGNWTNTGSWVGGVVPTNLDNVIIAAGHTITINNATPQCNNISFVDNTALLDLPNANSRLSIFGNFTLATTTHNPIVSWNASAVIRFSGNAALQTLSGWPINTAPPFAFGKLVVQKTAGKVVTEGNGMRLGIKDSLLITNGNFELATGDDIEGRNINGSGATQPGIVVNVDDSLIVTSINSHIRSGNNTGDDNAKIGNLTIYGYVSLNPGQTNKINFGNIDIKAGGELDIAGGGSNTNLFNPGTITVDSAAIFRTTKDVDYWFVNATTPTTLTITKGGELDINGVSNQNYLPTNFNTNTGSYIRYSKTAQTLSTDTRLATYSNLVLVGTAKTLAQNISVNDTLFMRTSVAPIEAPSLILNGFTLTYNTNAALVYRGIGGTPAAQTTGSTEWPATGNRPTHVQVFNSSNVTLNESKSIAGDIIFRNNSTGSKLILSSFNITASNIQNHDASSYVQTNSTGTISLTNIGASAKIFGVGNATYNPLTIANGSNLDWAVNVEDNVNVTDPAFVANVNGAVQRTWNILPSTNPPPAGADLTFQYNDGDPTQIGSSFDPSKLVQIWVKYLTDWYAVGVTQVPTGSAGGVRTVGQTNWSGYSPFAISNFDMPLPINLKQFTGSGFNNYNLINTILTNNAGVYLIEIEYSFDNINFQKINTFNTPQLNNEFKHFTNNNTTYYRAKIYGDATHYMYSPIIKVKKGAQPNQSFTTTIANNIITVFNIADNKKLNYTINSLDGKKVMQGVIANNQQINVNSLPKGIWFFVAEHNVVKFVVQ